MRFATALTGAGLVALAAADCPDMINYLKFTDVNAYVISSTYYTAGSKITIEGGLSVCGASAQAQPLVNICRVVLNIKTSNNSETYSEVWLPTGPDSNWNGRMMATDNGGLNGCVSYDDMSYTSSLGFATVGDNGGHNTTSSFYDNGDAFLNNNDRIVDWSYRSRHAAATAGKQVIQQYYGTAHNYSYYLGCSTGGRQGLKSAQVYPNDFDGIIAGSAAADHNHLSDWSNRMVLLTGADASDERFLTTTQWNAVHTEVLAQCDEALDGVADGIIEDSTICNFNATKMLCVAGQDGTCLSQAQVNTVYNVYSQLYDQDGTLLYPRFAPGAEAKAAAIGFLTGSPQGTSVDWMKFAVWNDTNWSPFHTTQQQVWDDYSTADALDVVHGKPSSFEGDLSALRDSGSKLLMYHGMMDPVVVPENAQRYYINVANTMGVSNAELDPFFRFFRISGGYHCSMGGVGAWAFGQSGPARNATDNIIDVMMDWVEKGQAPETLTGTKFNNDDPNQGIAFERAHCRFPYRTTYRSGDSNQASSWGCDLIQDWQECGPGSFPRLCGSPSDPKAIPS